MNDPSPIAPAEDGASGTNSITANDGSAETGASGDADVVAGASSGHDTAGDANRATAADAPAGAGASTDAEARAAGDPAAVDSPALEGPAPPASAGPDSDTAKKQAAQDLSPAACGAKLAELFPALFVSPATTGAPPLVKPIKLRIHADIQSRAPGLFSKRTLGIFFSRYTTSTPYLKALAHAPHRFDLDGQPAGEITEEHRAAAVEELARRRSIAIERRAGQRRDTMRPMPGGERGAATPNSANSDAAAAAAGAQPADVTAHRHDAVRGDRPPRPPRPAQDRRHDTRSAAPGAARRDSPRHPPQRARGEGQTPHGDTQRHGGRADTRAPRPDDGRRDRPHDGPRDRPPHDRPQGRPHDRPRGQRHDARGAGGNEVLLPQDPAQRERALLLRAFEGSTLNKANFCALKRLAEADLDAQLALARQERDAAYKAASQPGR